MIEFVTINFLMEKTALFLENRIKWRAARCMLPNKNVFLYENLTDGEKIKYSNYFNENSGKIILLFTDSKNNWTAIGTNMIIGYDGVRLNAVKLNTIDSVISKNFNELKDSSITKRKKINKKTESELLVTDFNGNGTVFLTNEGSDLFSLWNIILMISRFNK